jgi:uncharacterized protein YkwD
MKLNRRNFVGLMAFATIRANPAGDARNLEAQVFEAANRERLQRGLPALNWSAALATEARLHSERMARYGFFDHRDPERGNLAKRLKAAGIRYRACAENIYRQTGWEDSGSAAVKAWMRSRGHRENLLGRAYRSTGAGVAVDSSGHCLVTQVFLG